MQIPHEAVHTGFDLSHRDRAHDFTGLVQDADFDVLRLRLRLHVVVDHGAQRGVGADVMIVAVEVAQAGQTPFDGGANLEHIDILVL